ncbi:hypothetical protein [Corynebacterium mastitidis]|uniref:hypothetical protein n=1 Tax=Corynebacterium mastitidis TaxID=161890 RepID=UPI00037F8556|nr:hypothetical protein [Corynebacterium mastitidis]
MQPDVLKEIIHCLSDVTGVWVADTLPPGDSLSEELPCVRVDELPGTSKLIPWQITGEMELQELGIDVDVFGASRYETRAVREAIHKTMMLLPRTVAGITRVQPGATFHTRPDFNQNIRRVGAEYLVTARTG